MSSPVFPRRLPNLPLVCVALSGNDMAGRAASSLQRCTFFEFRLDTATAPAQAVSALSDFLAAHPSTTVLATCRRIENGGHFAGDTLQEAEILQAAAGHGASIIDLSVETAEALEHDAPEVLDQLRNTPATLLISWHDFHGTPDLDAVHTRIARLQPGLIKIVPTATTLDDALCLLDLLRRHAPDGNLVAMSMGTAGIPTRVLGPRCGSAFTFAAPDAAGATAPGQVDLHTLLDLYRVESIGSATRIYGVFGDPVTGSKSPAMLNAAFAAAGIDAVYLPLEANRADVLFRAVEGLQLAGASVTMPLKEQIVPSLAGSLSPLATTIGAANTLARRTDGALEGDNTDAAGITGPLSQRLCLQDAHVLVLGAGGAARAAVFALRAAGARVSILNRSAQRAATLAAEAGATAITRETAAATRYDAVVNATPHGMHGQSIPAPLLAEEMNTGIFFDLVYNPLETALLRAARARGITVIAGLEMFLAQGAAQFTLWTGEAAPAGVMREAVLQALR